jgi:hypothetical protein
MATYNFTRLKRLMMVYWIVQAVLLALLVFMAVKFQELFVMLKAPELFIKGIVIAIIIQLLMVYPAWLLAKRDVTVDISAAVEGLDGDQLLALRKKRLLGDLWKLCVMGFFAVFVLLAPGVDKGRSAAVILEAAYFSFLLVALTYFQCFNFAAKKQRSEVA